MVILSRVEAEPRRGNYWMRNGEASLTALRSGKAAYRLLPNACCLIQLIHLVHDPMDIGFRRAVVADAGAQFPSGVARASERPDLKAVHQTGKPLGLARSPFPSPRAGAGRRRARGGSDGGKG